MSEYKYLMINIDEIWTKGKNIKTFIRSLRQSIIGRTKVFTDQKFEFKQINHNFVLVSEIPFPESLIPSLAKIAGVHSVEPAVQIEDNFDEILNTLADQLDKIDIPTSFKVLTKRSDKNYPITSMEFSKKLGGMINQKYEKLQVKMVDPDLNIKIRIFKEAMYLSTKELVGMGGLPSGTSGKALTLLSGGFDSPVASYLLTKRGLAQDFIFFHSYPYVGDEVKDKIKDLFKILREYHDHAQLYIVPFGPIQKKIADHCKENLRTILMRKAMVEVANAMAPTLKAEAIIMGDSLGQVSSQTLANLNFVNHCTQIPILRPLISSNKDQIIELSKTIGTHDISILPHDDACALFAPKNPILNPKLGYINYYNDMFSIEDEINEALQNCEQYYVNKKFRVKMAGKNVFNHNQ
jgi:thiamine biosynthesis protein ThiI